MLEENRANNANLEFWEKLQIQRTEFLKQEAEKRVDIEKDAGERTAAAQEEYFASVMTPEQNIKRKIQALEKSGPSSVDDVNKTKDPLAKADIAERVAKVVSLKRELLGIETQIAEKQQQELKIAQEKQAVVDENMRDLNAEIGALDLRRSGQTQMAIALTEENRLRKEAAALAEAVNISEKEALKIIQAKIATQEETRLVAGGLSVRTKDRAEKRAAAKQQRKEDARLRNNPGEKIKDRNDELLPGGQGKDRDQVAREKRGEAKPGDKPADVMAEIQKAVQAIQKLVEKIEPKLPTSALGV